MSRKSEQVRMTRTRCRLPSLGQSLQTCVLFGGEVHASDKAYAGYRTIDKY